MSWPEFLKEIESDLGKEIASQIEEIGRKKFGGQRITIFSKKIITKEIVDLTAAGKPKEAARKLGVSLSTVYRTIQNKPIIR